jgi:uncharacterized protein YecE (DUF72 family)
LSPSEWRREPPFVPPAVSAYIEESGVRRRRRREGLPMGRARIGTCSWLYPSWKGLVYSSANPPDPLREYAARYDTVDIDRWFWSLFGEDRVRLPEPSDARAYRDSVPASFRFTVKVPNSITLSHLHRARGESGPLVRNPHFLSVALFGEFLDRIGPLHDVLGPILFQFEYLNRQKMASRARFIEAFGAFVSALPPSFCYAVETRNGAWLDRSWFEFLERSRLAPVLLQGYWMPQVPVLFEEHASSIARRGPVVVRLHGPDRGGIEKETGKRWDRIAAPKDAELDRIAEMVKRLVGAGIEVYLNVNNHYEGSAPITIERIRERLGPDLAGPPAKSTS